MSKPIVKKPLDKAIAAAEKKAAALRKPAAPPAAAPAAPVPGHGMENIPAVDPKKLITLPEIIAWIDANKADAKVLLGRSEAFISLVKDRILHERKGK